MDIVQGIILGVVQGLTEFLPISSSGHLVLAPWFFGWEDAGLSFSVALHVGTLIAVVAFFWKDWLKIFSQFFRYFSRGQEQQNKEGEFNDKMLLFIFIATIPGVLAGYFLNDLAENAFRNPLLIASTLFVFGVFLFFADIKAKRSREIGQIGWLDAIVIGVAQAMAIVPGVSRSGVTITAGLVLGLDRKSAARFSFLLSTPVILGAAVYQAPAMANSHFGVVEVIGIIVAAISGFMAIKWLIFFVERASYKIFFWYRVILALTIVLLVVMNR